MCVCDSVDAIFGGDTPLDGRGILSTSQHLPEAHWPQRSTSIRCGSAEALQNAGRVDLHGIWLSLCKFHVHKTTHGKVGAFCALQTITKPWMRSSTIKCIELPREVICSKQVTTIHLCFSLLNTYIPTGIVVIMSWGSFWLDVNAAPARASIGVTSVLTTVTQIVQSRNNAPPVDYLKVSTDTLFHH